MERATEQREGREGVAHTQSARADVLLCVACVGLVWLGCEQEKEERYERTKRHAAWAHSDRYFSARYADHRSQRAAALRTTSALHAQHTQQIEALHQLVAVLTNAIAAKARARTQRSTAAAAAAAAPAAAAAAAAAAASAPQVPAAAGTSEASGSGTSSASASTSASAPVPAGSATSGAEQPPATSASSSAPAPAPAAASTVGAAPATAGSGSSGAEVTRDTILAHECVRLHTHIQALNTQYAVAKAQMSGLLDRHRRLFDKYKAIKASVLTAAAPPATGDPAPAPAAATAEQELSAALLDTDPDLLLTTGAGGGVTGVVSGSAAGELELERHRHALHHIDLNHQIATLTAALSQAQHQNDSLRYTARSACPLTLVAACMCCMC
jgi:hypothetical protein